MLALLTLIVAVLYGSLLAYFRVPTAVTYVGLSVGVLGLGLLAAQSLRLVRYAKLTRVLWQEPHATRCSTAVLYDRSATAALWAAFGGVLLIVGLLIEALVLFLLFPNFG
jgi:hypothetical protein